MQCPLQRINNVEFEHFSILGYHANQSCWINIFAITIKVDIKLSAMIDKISLLVQELSLLLGTEIGK